MTGLETIGAVAIVLAMQVAGFALGYFVIGPLLFGRDK